MATYLVDHENVSENGLKGLGNLNENDKVVIIHFGNLCKKLKEKLDNSNAKIEYIEQKVHTPNSLDFKIVSYIGILAGKNTNEEIAIISNDNGYLAAVEYLQSVVSNVLVISGTIKEARDFLCGIGKNKVDTYIAQHLKTPKEKEKIAKSLKLLKEKDKTFRKNDNPKTEEAKALRKRIQQILNSNGGNKLASQCETVRIALGFTSSYEEFEFCIKEKYKLKAGTEICNVIKKSYNNLKK